MLPYLLLLAPPAGAAIMAVRRPALLLLVIAFLYWFLIGWRFQIGVDWNNYLYIYEAAKNRPFGELVSTSEPAFRAMLWIGSVTGGGVILINAISAFVFCFGFFAMARRCREPFLAICVATPLVAVAVAMSGIRQAMAMGVIYYLFATWEKRGTLARTGFVLLASMFHFSAVFNGIFVALGSRLSPLARIAAAAVVLLATFGTLWIFPDRLQFYSEAYLGEGSVTSPGALAHVFLLVAPALVYFVVRGHWQRVIGESELVRNMAIAALLSLPAVFVTSVGASRFSFYLWPVAMYVWSGLPGLMRSEAARYLYRIAVVAGCALVLILWLEFANSSWAYLPYRNWFWAPDHAPLLRR